MKTESDTIYEYWTKNKDIPNSVPSDGDGGRELPPKTSIGTGDGNSCPRCQGMKLVLENGVLIRCPECKDDIKE